jgi:Tfp pilus assembly PilM family ATPase
VGLELAREQVHIAQLQRLSDGALTLRAGMSSSYPATRDELMGSSALFKSFLKQHLKPEGFHGRRVVAAIPASKVRILSITYPGNRAQTDAEALLQVLKERVDGELTDYVIDYLPVRPGTQEEQHLAVVALAKRSAVLAFLELMRAAGLQG